MEKEVSDVMTQILAHVSKKGLSWSIMNKWRVGLCSPHKANTILSDKRRVDMCNGEWIYRTLSNNDVAKTVAKGLVTMGMAMCDTGKGNVVYAYRSDDNTLEGRTILLEKCIYACDRRHLL